MKDMRYACKCIIVGDAILLLKNKCRDDHDGMVQCFVCGEWCDDQKHKVNVFGERVEMQHVLCENCCDNIRPIIKDMEEKLEKDGHYY